MVHEHVPVNIDLLRFKSRKYHWNACSCSLNVKKNGIDRLDAFIRLNIDLTSNTISASVWWQLCQASWFLNKSDDDNLCYRSLGLSYGTRIESLLSVFSYLTQWVKSWQKRETNRKIGFQTSNKSSESKFKLNYTVMAHIKHKICG